MKLATYHRRHHINIYTEGFFFIRKLFLFSHPNKIMKNFEKSDNKDREIRDDILDIRYGQVKIESTNRSSPPPPPPPPPKPSMLALLLSIKVRKILSMVCSIGTNRICRF